MSSYIGQASTPSPTITPGPWVSSYDDDTGEHRVHAADGLLICCVGNGMEDVEQQERDAGAIASLPDLLAALKAAATWIGDDLRLFFSPDGERLPDTTDFDLTEHIAIANKIDAALAKASQ